MSPRRRRAALATSQVVGGALASLLVLGAGAGLAMRRIEDVRHRLTAVAVEEARRWSSEEIGVLAPPEVQHRVRDAVRSRVQEIEAMRVEVVERPDPGMAGVDQYVVRIYGRMRPLDFPVADLGWTLQVEGVFARENDYRPGDLLRRARASSASEDFPSWR